MSSNSAPRRSSNRFRNVKGGRLSEMSNMAPTAAQGDEEDSPGSRPEVSNLKSNNNYTQFEVVFPVQSDYIKRAAPKRIQQKSVPQQQITAQEIQEKQRLAGERKKKIDEHKSRQARKVSQDAIRYDKMITGRLAQEQSVGQPTWFKGALKNIKKDTT